MKVIGAGFPFSWNEALGSPLFDQTSTTQIKKKGIYQKLPKKRLFEVIGIGGPIFDQKLRPIAADQEQGHKTSITSYSYNGPWSKVGSPIPMTSQWPQTAFARLLLICSLILDLSSTGLIKKRGTQCFKSRKREPYPYQAQMAEFEVTSFLIRLLELWSRMR